MGDTTPIGELLRDVVMSFSEMTELGLKEVLNHWETIFGTSSEPVVEELTTELQKQFQDFWNDQSAKLKKIEEEYVKKINIAGMEAIQLEKALGLKPEVTNIPNHGPLMQVEENLQSLLESYQELKKERLNQFLRLQKQEKELANILDITSEEKAAHGDPCYVPTSDEITEMRKRITQLERLKEQLEYDFEDVKSDLQQVMEEIQMVPVTVVERFVFGQVDLPVTKKNFVLLKEKANEYEQMKNDMITEAGHLRDQIDQLSKKMFKDPIELEQFMADHSGFSAPTVKKLKEKLAELKEERKQNLNTFVGKCREALKELWEKCCFSEAQRNAFSPFKTTWITEEVLEIHDLEIDALNKFYNDNKKIFNLAKKHEELWDQLLHLEDLANDKGRFNNRGGCLLKEEKERKVIQKKLPAIKTQLLELLDAYKEENGKDFLHFGEPLYQKIEMKEHLREISKRQERLHRKEANAGNITGIKRKAAAAPCPDNRFKSMRTETPSCVSSKSTTSSKSGSSAILGTKVRREQEKKQYTGQMDPTLPPTICVMHTPSTSRAHTSRVPASSTPQNGSLSYESFQEHIEKSKHLQNSTRNLDQRALRPRNLNQTQTFIKTPKTPGKTLLKTSSNTRTPFKFATGSKIPEKPPVSPRTPGMSTTKLPIIF